MADGSTAETLTSAPTAAATDQDNHRNLLLQRLAPTDVDLFAAHLERVPLESGAELAKAGEPIDFVCFPEGGVAGFLDVLGDGRRLTVGLVGREGLIGWPMLMGHDRWPYDVVVTAEAGTSLRLPADALRCAVDASPGLRDLLLRYTATFVTQMGRTIVSNLIHSIERRTARWILLYQDRVGGDEIALTHEEFGLMLGVRRASITDALHLLEGQQVIVSARGRVIVRDRARLESMAGETYGHAEAEYERLIGRRM